MRKRKRGAAKGTMLACGGEVNDFMIFLKFVSELELHWNA